MPRRQRDDAEYYANLIKEVQERIAHNALVRDVEKLWQTLLDADDFRAVVLGQAWVENAIILLIERHLHYRKRFNLVQMGYVQKLNLASALGELSIDELRILETLAPIRNRFAHRLNATLLPEDDVNMSREIDKVVNINGAWTFFRDEVKKLDNWPGPAFTPEQVTFRAVVFLMHQILNQRLGEPRPTNPSDIDFSPQIEALLSEQEVPEDTE